MARKKKSKLLLKTPKGTRDFDEVQMAVREHVFEIITTAFKRHGAVTIDTPVFERRDLLLNKYGDDQKLIYDLVQEKESEGQDETKAKKKGPSDVHEQCSLRYDLTVSFARYMAQNRKLSMKRFQIGRVYRRDQPAIERGRFREFYQCDFDYAGVYDAMIPDSECVVLMGEILSALDIGAFEIKVNHRGLLDALFGIAGVPTDQFRTVCSSIDKLDKQPWSEVEDELVNKKNVEPAVATRLATFFAAADSAQGDGGDQRIGPEQLERLAAEMAGDGKEKDMELLNSSLAQLALLRQYVGAMGGTFQFDVSLARGLDYYTGAIFEAVLVDGSLKLGSIGGGGRYDNLIRDLAGGGLQVPAVGFSIGIERVFAILERRARDGALSVRSCATEVFLFCKAMKPSEEGAAEFNQELLLFRMSLLRQLWAAGIAAETDAKLRPRDDKQEKRVNEARIPVVVNIGESEMKSRMLPVRFRRWTPAGERQEEGNDGDGADSSTTVAVDALVDTILKFVRQ